MPRALPLLMLEITLSLTVAVAGGARFSTVTNAITAVGFYGVAFIGGFVEQIGGFAGITSMRTIGVLVSLISPADSMWRLAAQLHAAGDCAQHGHAGARRVGAVDADGVVGGGVYRADAALRHPRVPSPGIVARVLCTASPSGLPVN